jgi:hypothetical protein
LLVVKDRAEGGQLFVRSLTPQEMIHLERNPDLLRNPRAILEALADASRPPTSPAGVHRPRVRRLIELDGEAEEAPPRKQLGTGEHD